MADDAKRSTFRIVHAHAAGAEKLANDLAEDFVLSNINFYVFRDEEKVAMLFVRKAPVAAGSALNSVFRR